MLDCSTLILISTKRPNIHWNILCWQNWFGGVVFQCDAYLLGVEPFAFDKLCKFCISTMVMYSSRFLPRCLEMDTAFQVFTHKARRLLRISDKACFRAQCLANIAKRCITENQIKRQSGKKWARLCNKAFHNIFKLDVNQVSDNLSTLKEYAQ